MEPNPYEQSVVAKLMGLEEMPLRQPIHTQKRVQKRVLSENYLRKTASIGIREKRPIKEGHSFSTNIEKVQEFKVALGLPKIFKSENEIYRTNEAFGSRQFEDFRSQRKIEKITPRNILRSHQKLENGVAIESYGDLCLPTKIVILKPRSVKDKSGVKSSMFLSSQSGKLKQEFSSPINMEWHTKSRERGTHRNALEYLRHDFIALKNSRGKELITPKSGTSISTASWNVSNSGVRGNETSPKVAIPSDYSIFAREAKERLMKRWKMTKVAQEVRGVNCSDTLSEILSLPDLELRPKTLKISGNNGSTPNLFDVMEDTEIKNVEGSSKQRTMPLADDVKYRSSPCSFDGSAGEESQIRSHEYVVDYLNCMSSGETYQPSPNSVLEPSFKEDSSPVSHCHETINADLQDLWMQLQLLKSESEETISEGTGMIISSDGDTTEKSVQSSSKKMMKFLREGESRDFSYLLDILEESGIQGGPTILSVDSWHSTECVLSPLVFEALEKKYSDQTSWNMAERRLLFDRVNVGLMEILKPWLDIHVYTKPLRKKVGNALRREVIEEELWSLIVSEKNEVKKELAEKAVGSEKWVEYWDEVETIAIDIEKFLFDKLVEELVWI